MGSMQFLVPNRPGLSETAVRCAYMVGQDGAPWESRVTLVGGRLVVERDTRESGRLVTPWFQEEHGVFALSTTTLSPRSRPYHLALELCRGTLARVLDAAWQRVDDTKCCQLLQSARQEFIQAALLQDDLESSAAHAELAMGHCLGLIRHLFIPSQQQTRTYSSRLTGIQIGSSQELRRVTERGKPPGNSICFAPSWCEVEPNPNEWNWSPTQQSLARIRRLRRRTITGPLFRLKRQFLPDWLYLWGDNFDALQSYVVNYVASAVRHLKEATNVWYASASTNTDLELHLSEEQRLRLTLTTLETVRQQDTQTPVLVGVRQPWGEYLGHSSLDLSPWQFADIAVRTDLGVSGFVWEIAIDCNEYHTLPRDLLEVNHLIEQWTAFGLPLVVLLSAPTGVPNRLTQPVRFPEDYLTELIELFQQHPAIQGVLWQQLVDNSEQHDGLFDEQSKPKPIYGTLEKLWNVPNG